MPLVCRVRKDRKEPGYTYGHPGRCVLPCGILRGGSCLAPYRAPYRAGRVPEGNSPRSCSRWILYSRNPEYGRVPGTSFSRALEITIPDHVCLFSVDTLASLLGREGFTVLRRKTWGGLGAGTAPRPIKYLFDRAAKLFGFGDVMIILSIKA